VIRDAGLFEILNAMQNPGPDALTADLIARAARVKVDIVNADEREQGDRMLLNYGHTLGHALEAATGFNTFTHGEAVTIGMHLEAQIAAGLGMVGSAFVERQRALIQAHGLPTELPARVPTDQLVRLTLRDKKVQAGKVRWALPTDIGGAVTRNDVPETLVRAVINSSRE
jgi:3-dehydroquinate synthase